ncbi:hypothetical protein BDR05DRAFT_963111 [Suillus weaverae]|nr:hypothetical protein BDR05DRAFT_963111 [Suillus weaverae]
MAEMKNVLSPISERMIVIKERMRVSAEKSVGGVGSCVDILNGRLPSEWANLPCAT